MSTRTLRTRAAVIGATSAYSLLVLVNTTALHAQDVEARSWVSGRPLPAAYFDRVREDPSFFELTHGWIARANTASLTASAVQGRLPLLVVQALFADSPDPSVTPQEIQRVLFDGPAQHGTLTEYYRELSANRLEVTGRVLPWVRTATARAAAVGTSYGLGSDAQLGTFLLQAITAADPHVNFGDFDNDGPDNIPNSGDDDGLVDAVAFQFIERAANCPGDGVWPHRSRISGWGSQTGGSYQSADLRPNGQPVRVNDYIIQSTVQCDGTTPLTASVIAHEMGHVLGLPDLYHAAGGILPEQRRWVIGCWSLMSAGSWGCGSSTNYGLARPTHMGPWEKSTLGWIEDVLVGAVRDREYILEPVQTAGRALRVPLSATEFLYIEYRPRTGFDINLPASGVLIYHIEPARPLYPPVSGPRVYRISLEEADADDALLKNAQEGGNRGVASDAWGTAGTMSFSNITLPSTRRNTGAPSTVTIHSIRVENNRAILRISTAATPDIVSTTPSSAAALANTTSQLRAAGGALPYQWTVTGALPTGVSAVPDGDQLTLSGTPLEAGAFELQLEIRDALGTVTTRPLTFTVAPAALPPERLLQPFTLTSATPLTEAELTYLDLSGNRNGRYDVGDLRRYLKSTR